MNNKKHSHIPDPWASMEQLFKKGFPFSSFPHPTEFMMNPDWLAHIVHTKEHQAQPQLTANEHYQHTLYETHKHVIVRIQLPPSINAELLRLYVASTSLRIEGFPDRAEKKVRLPCEVNRIGIRSSFKDGILEVRMVKKASTEQERQINITIL